MFYRNVDTLAGELGEQLREMEQKMFRDIVKVQVEAELGDWLGSKEQNHLADITIVKNVKSAFNEYEKNKKSYEKSYFVFKNGKNVK